MSKIGRAKGRVLRSVVVPAERLDGCYGLLESMDFHIERIDEIWESDSKLLGYLVVFLSQAKKTEFERKALDTSKQV